MEDRGTNHDNHHQNNWDELLPSTEFVAANHIHLSTQTTPFVADTGWNPHMGFELSVDVANEDVVAFWDHMKMSLEEAQAALSKAQAEYVLYYNRQCDLAPIFRSGDWVLLNASDIQTDWPSKKLNSLCLGPFKVVTAAGKAAYKLELPHG